MVKRIQRKRTRGWRMPRNAVYVGRPTVFGNPFAGDPQKAAAAYRRYLTQGTVIIEVGPELDLYLARYPHWMDREDALSALPSLRGCDLACWCPLDQPCHADILIELANSTAERLREVTGR